MPGIFSHSVFETFSVVAAPAKCWTITGTMPTSCRVIQHLCDRKSGPSKFAGLLCFIKCSLSKNIFWIQVGCFKVNSKGGRRSIGAFFLSSIIFWICARCMKITLDYHSGCPGVPGRISASSPILSTGKASGTNNTHLHPLWLAPSGDSSRLTLQKVHPGLPKADFRSPAFVWAIGFSFLKVFFGEYDGSDLGLFRS